MTDFPESPLQNAKSGLAVYTSNYLDKFKERRLSEEKKKKKKPRQAAVANGSRGSQGGSEGSHTVLGGYAARSALLEGSPTVNIFSIASDNPPKTPQT